MTDFRNLLANLRRPRLLIHAASFGLPDYRRERDLKRLIGGALPPERSFRQLMSEEARLEETRREGTAGYSLTRHIEVLIALMGEARLLPQRLDSEA